jgi:MSHA biogenesis protein MshN
MSVINQMLKDLDERQSEHQQGQTNQILMKKPSTPWKIITFIVIIVIALNIAGIFIWQLYSENKTLKTINESSYDQNQQAQQLVKGLENKLLTSKSEKNIMSNDDIVLSEVDIIENTTREKVTQNLKADQESLKLLPSMNKAETTIHLNEDSIHKPIANSIDKTKSENNLVVNHSAENITSIKETFKPTLSISRKQLTATELTQQKIDQAEQALAENKLSKAEKLFEDVLLMTPEHKTARKQLAALWFGRQSYQPAINVLSQGVQLYPDDSEFRLMKARIYLNQGQTVAAVNTLKDLPYVENVEYQALLASHAQQISQFDVATTAYNLLTSIEPNAGRWWLGLAVAYDSNSEFDQAIKAYGQAIDKSDLSENARQFARQRVQELGE